MKGGNITLKRQDYRFLLNVCKDYIKLNFFIKEYKLSQSALSRFINDDKYNMISDKTVKKLCDEIYSCCLLYVDLYNEKMNNEKIV